MSSSSVEAAALPSNQQRITVPKSPSLQLQAEGQTKNTSPSGSETPITCDAHRKWANDAWEAIRRSLIRYPASHSDLSQPSEKQKFLEIYTRRSEDGTAMKWLKYHLAYIFAYAWGQVEYPKPPGDFLTAVGEKPGRFFSGPFGRALVNVMARGRAGSMPYRRCAYDILMSKLGFPKAPQAFVDAALQDHRSALSRDPPKIYGSEEESRQACCDRGTISEVKGKIDQICDAVFKNVRFRHMDQIPSARACQEAGIADGGGFGHLLRGFQECHSFLPDVDVLCLMLEVQAGVVNEIRFIDMSERVSLFQDYVDKCWRSRLHDRLQASPVPILEPLKVRVITKGQAAEYYRCIELQKLMHGAMRKHPVFQCIGHPIEEDDFAETFRSKAELQPGQFFVSGDYKAATDNLNPELTEYAWLSICERVHLSWDAGTKLSETDYYTLGRKALVCHDLYYDKKSPPIPQSWGQLMGSPMSFPILCLVNAAATLVSLKEDFCEGNRMRVNGDDIAFIANEGQYERWKRVTKVCGLEFSMGKNYTSREFIIMNSELRRAPETRRWEAIVYEEDEFLFDENDKPLRVHGIEMLPVSWKFEGFANQCLLYNTIKKGMDAGRMKDTYWTDLSSISEELLRGIPPRDQWKLYGVFFKTYKTQLEEAPSLCNKWFPKSLGGMGLRLPVGVDFLDTNEKVLTLQRKQAAYLACNPKARLKRVSRQRELFGALSVAFKEVRELSDSQVEKRIVRKLRNRECTVLRGGATMLGYLLSTRPLPDESFGGLAQERSGAHHAMVAGRLRRDYDKWLGRKARRTSLHPMDLENISGYVEHLEMASFVEIYRTPPSSRAMDGNEVHFGEPLGTE